MNSAKRKRTQITKGQERQEARPEEKGNNGAASRTKRLTGLCRRTKTSGHSKKHERKDYITHLQMHTRFLRTNDSEKGYTNFSD